MLESWLFFALCLAVFGLIGYYLLTYRIMADHDVKNKSAVFIFCLVFSFSVNSLAIILFEIWQMGSEQQRLQKWLINLSVLVAATLIVLPNLLLYKLIKKLSLRKPIKYCLLIFILLSLLLSVALHVQANIKQKQASMKDAPEEASSAVLYTALLNAEIDFITKIGTYLIAILSGFGAVNCPISYFNFHYQNIQSLQDSKRKIEENIHFILQEISKNMYQVVKLRENLEKEDTTTQKQPGIFGKFLIMIGAKDEPTTKRHFLKEIDLKNTETQGLVQMHHELFQQYVYHQSEMMRHEFSKTLQGRFFKLLSFVFAIYCLYKIVMSTFNYIVGRKLMIDPVQRTIRIIFGILRIDENYTDYYNVVTNYTSFGFMGFLIFSNTRSFTLNIVNFLTPFTGALLTKVRSNDVIVYFLSIMFSVYFLSTLVLLQTSIPQKYLQNLSKITSDIDILAHYRVFDIVFLVSAFSSLVILTVNLSLRNQKLKGYQEKKGE